MVLLRWEAFDKQMDRGIMRDVCGHIQPLIINKDNVPGDIAVLIDWSAISNFHRPLGSLDYIFKGQLEYLQCDYYIKSLNTIKSDNLPKVNQIRDPNLTKQTKYAEFKRKYNVSTGHTVELMIHTKWESQDWNPPKAGEFLYNLGQYGYLNLFDPYLLRDSEILYSDTRYKIGVSIDGILGDFDYIEINGGYSGTISYFEEEDPTASLSESADSVAVGTQPTQILPQRFNRKISFISNDGNSRLYFRFTNNSSGVSTSCPFLEPKESLTLTPENFSWSGGNYHQYIKTAARHYIPLRCYGIRESGTGNVFYQEFY